MTHARRLRAGLLASALMGAPLGAQDTVATLSVARDHVARGRLAEGVETYRHILAADSMNVAAWTGLGGALNRMARYPEALDVLERAVRLDSVNFVARFNRALVYSELARYDDAIADLSWAIARRPAFAPAWTERGAALSLLGHADQARHDWQRALRLDSTYVWPHYYAGIAAIVAGDYAQAARELDVVAGRQSLLSAHLWRWVAYRRAGRDAPPLDVADAWPGPVAAFLNGVIDAGALLRAARATGFETDERRLATAHFFIGQWQLASGARDAGIQSLRRVLSARSPRLAEVVAADAELRRLSP